jgi:hypothetical protein
MPPPDDSIQYAVDPWWTRDDRGGPDRGRLLRALVPYPDQEPRRLVIEGRAEAREHERALYRVEPFRAGATLPPAGLPVAGMPQAPGEEFVVYKGKLRPVLVLSEGGPAIPAALRVGAARWPTAPTLLVAPYYGADQDGTRGGWRPDFVQRIRRAEYPQYIWDSLPIGGPRESILRLDHLFPIARNPAAFEVTEHRLTADALGIVDEWLRWLVTTVLVEGGLLADIRAELLAMP